MGAYTGLIIISVLFTVIGMIVSGRLKSKFKKYGSIPLSAGLSGREVAERMLREYGIGDVTITQGRGQLTDHYNPKTKTVSLSPAIYQGRSIMAAAVAAHECGHAVQHAEGYQWLKMRSAIVPLVQISASIQQYLFMLAFVLIGSLGEETFLLIAIFAFLGTALFSVITLPVEFDASRRALVWLDGANVARGAEYEGAKDALWWAAMTYVTAALAAVVQLLYLVIYFMGSRE